MSGGRTRILVVAPALPHERATNAGALVVYEQLRLLAERHSITLAAFAGPDGADRAGIESLRQLGIHVHAVWRPPYERLDLWRRRLQVFVFASRSWYQWLRGRYPRLAVHFREPEMQALISSLLGSQTFDIVQVEDSVMASYDLPNTARTVLVEHEVRLPEGGGPSDPEAKRWRRYLPPVLKSFDRVQVFTSRDAAAIRAVDAALAERVRINPFGIRLPEVEPRPGGEGLVFVGGFNHPPNVDAACSLVEDIMPLVWERLPQLKLTLVGKEPPPQVLALASEGVEVTGRVESVEPYLATAAVVVAPLRQGGGMRMKVLQAMAAGKPVVTTSLGAEGLAGDREGLPLIITDDVSAFAEQTVRLLSDPDTRHTLGNRAREFVREHHRWDSYVERLEAIYDELVAES